MIIDTKNDGLPSRGPDGQVTGDVKLNRPNGDPFVAALRRTRMPMVITDPRQRDNPIVFANAAFYQLTGYVTEEVIGRNCRFLQGPATNAAHIAEIREAIRRQEPIQIKIQNYRKDGKPFWNDLSLEPVFDDVGTLVYFSASLFAITSNYERLRHFDDDLTLNERALDALVRSSTEVRYRISADWSELHQLKGGAFIHDTKVSNLHWLDSYIPPEDRDAVRAEIARATRTKSTYLIEHRVNRVDGSIGWALSRAVPMLDDMGEIREWFGAASDITERKKAEEALREVHENLEERVAQAIAERGQFEDQLRQSQKLEAIGQLTGGVAHDFNNLLTVIRSSTDFLKRPDLSEERRRRYVEAISETVDRASKLTGQLLSFARRQALKPEVFAACDAVRSISEMMDTLTGTHISVEYVLPGNRCFVKVDPIQFDTALVNIAVNARDAMGQSGQLTITVQPVEELPVIRNHPAVRGSYVAVMLTDTGCGIAPAQQERIFEPFFTTKETGKGTGLGLSQVFGFAKQSGGEIAVESTLGKGTTFTIYLPQVESVEPAGEVESSKGLFDGQGLHVLVVEDNTSLGQFAIEMLTDLGFLPVLACDAQAALSMLADDAHHFDVVFTDVVMPGMSGIELAQAVRCLYPDLPVVLTSGYSHVLAKNGTYGFELLHKPYSMEDASQALRKAAGHSKPQRSIVDR
ncbi:PAS domain S-box protein [Pseudomonas coleopterorum]|uniref:PAS domain S-box protein n=1 Tax=Pseudomonas coleopterorum TaxID=1605838 RepID=UPI002A6AB3A0|nr:PAS domain S-box protein [Pseudomonas coleopterorum]MDY1045226.1 PAS domain S-box protein [Pseudomonas coleopterorum]